MREIEAFYKESSLPATRYEFEQRATLYLVLMEVQQFLSLKEDFIQNLSPKELQTFQKNVLS